MLKMLDSFVNNYEAIKQLYIEGYDVLLDKEVSGSEIIILKQMIDIFNRLQNDTLIL